MFRRNKFIQLTFSFFMLTLVCNLQVSGVFKMTKLHCENHNKSIVVINSCRLRPVSRNITVLFLNVTLQRSVFSINAHIHVAKKANGYKPFLWDFNIDLCGFLKKNNHPVMNILYNLFGEFSNLNHTCPYNGDIVVDGFYPKLSALIGLPLPNGEYAIYFTFFERKFKAFDINVFFDFVQ